MNARTQITLEPTLQRRAYQRAAELGISFAEYVRRVVASDLGQPKRRPDVSAVFDLVSGGSVSDIARDKDGMIADAVWREHERKVGGTKTAGPVAATRHRKKSRR